MHHGAFPKEALCLIRLLVVVGLLCAWVFSSVLYAPTAVRFWSVVYLVKDVCCACKGLQDTMQRQHVAIAEALPPTITHMKSGAQVWPHPYP